MKCPTCHRFISAAQVRCQPCAVAFARSLDTDRMMYEDPNKSGIRPREYRVIKRSHAGVIVGIIVVVILGCATALAIWTNRN